MRGLKQFEQTAIDAVAEHFGATQVALRAPADVRLRIAGRQISATLIAATPPKLPAALVREPRLRFDKVALRLVNRLRAMLSGSIPERVTVVITITAPIRVPGRSIAALEEKIRGLLAAPTARGRLTATIHGNRVQVHV